MSDGRRGRGRAVALAVLAAAAAGAALVAADGARLARERRRELADGRRRPLRDLWRTVDGRATRARAATEGVAAGESGPDAPPLVLVHGFGVSSRYWQPAAERLAARHAVYVPDLPGHGRSAAPPRALTVPELAAALLAWMDAAGLARAVLVGHSMGCQIAVEAALRAPARVAGLVLVAPTVDPAARSLPRQLLRLLAAVPRERPALVPLVAADYLRMLPRALGELRAMLDHRIERRLPLLAVPTVVVHGADDPVAPPRWAREAAALAGAGRVEIPDAAHAAQFSDAPAFVAALDGLAR